MGVTTDGNLCKPYADYLSWLTIHHPLKKTSASVFLFDEGRIKRAIADSVFAERMFGKWKRSGFDSDGVFNKLQPMYVKATDDLNKSKLYGFYQDYFNWPQKYFPSRATA
ncbi:unnamed protein product [Phytophthora lilii]|uniref:Unnamed protein product n=1 Tax=Phytophthora lilii TaxID=2077276 RepID=A0A9W6TC75_9STRA|nr:unnamed protein product [Phytophthora lilii]